MKKQLKHNIKVYESGLIINPTFHGASPEGKVVDKITDEPYGILKIMCPFKYRNKCPSAADEVPEIY